MAEDVWTHICTCDQCIRFKQPREKSEMKRIFSFLSTGNGAFGFSHIGRKTDASKSINVLIVTDQFTKYV